VGTYVEEVRTSFEIQVTHERCRSGGDRRVRERSSFNGETAVYGRWYGLLASEAPTRVRASAPLAFVPTVGNVFRATFRSLHIVLSFEHSEISPYIKKGVS